jgi:hypothetical protein
VQPDAAIAGKKHQSIRRLDTHILKINTQTHRAFKRQFIQRFLSLTAPRQELDGNNKPVKTIMRWTGAGESTVKNWASGLRGPSGAHLIALMRNSDVTFEAVMMLAGRPRAIAPENIAAARVQLVELLAFLDRAVERRR